MDDEIVARRPADVEAQAHAAGALLTEGAGGRLQRRGQPGVRLARGGARLAVDGTAEVVEAHRAEACGRTAALVRTG